MKRRSKNIMSDDGGVVEKKRKSHQGQELFQMWFTPDEHLRAKFVAKQYGFNSVAGFFRFMIMNPPKISVVMDLASIQEKLDERRELSIPIGGSEFK